MSKKLEKKWKKAVWQYLIDHAKPVASGYRIQFTMKNERTFWERVRARDKGYFKRNDMEKMQKAHERILKAFIKRNKQNKEYRASRNLIKQKGTLMEKMRLKTSDNLKTLSKAISPIKNDYNK